MNFSKKWSGIGVAVLAMFSLILATPAFAREFTSALGLAFSLDLGEGQGCLTDQAGRKIIFDRPFQRIISLYGAHTENLFSLGAGDALIGVGRHDQYPEAARAKPVFSYHDDGEKFLAARPDLVLIRPMIDRGYRGLMARLEKSGIVVVSIQPRNVGQMFEYWRVLGALSGRGPAAEEMIRTFSEAVVDFRNQAPPKALRKGVYFQAIHRKMRTITRDSMADFALEVAGGINVARDGVSSRGTNLAVYGVEKILARADLIDVLLVQHGAMDRPPLEMVKKEPGFSMIKAVREDEVYIIHEHLVSRPTMRLILGIREIQNILYPGRGLSGGH